MATTHTLAPTEEAAPIEYPPGAPDLGPMPALQPRSRRAEFKRKYIVVAEHMLNVRDLEAKAERIKGENARQVALMGMWAETDDLVQAVLDMLRIAAVDEAKFDSWAETASDEDVFATFAAYQPSMAEPSDGGPR